MKTFSASCFSLALCVLGLFSGIHGYTQTVYNTVPVTGFTDDVVANIPGPANQSANNDMDGGVAPVRFCFVTQNYRNPAGSGPTTFLPANGFFNSAATPGLSFQLADYNANNTMRIKGVGIGVLTFTTPQAARVLYLLGGAGNSLTGPTYFDATINFTDGTSQVFSNLFFTDWFGMLDVVALQGVSRVNFDTNVIENSSSNPSLYQKPLYILPANYGKLIRSIDILKTGNLATLNILAVSAGTGCPVAPAGGRAVASSTNFCIPVPINLSLSGAATDPEITIQWQASINSGQTWTDIPNATTANFTVTPTVTTQYRARLVCGLQTGVSAPITVNFTLVKPTLAYSNTDFCQSGTSPAPAFGPIGGTFSGTPDLAINEKTGVIDLTRSKPGKHTVTYTGPAPCLGKTTTEISIKKSPTLAYGITSYCQFGISQPPAFTPKGGAFSGTSGLVIDENTGIIDLSQSIPGKHIITYTEPAPCLATTTSEINIEGSSKIEFPNIITANGDGLNDKLQVKPVSVSGYNLQVYNRWGSRIWNSNSPEEGWEGKNNSAGVYYYLVRFQDCTGRSQQYKGYVEVIR